MMTAAPRYEVYQQAFDWSGEGSVPMLLRSFSNQSEAQGFVRHLGVTAQNGDHYFLYTIRYEPVAA